MTRTSLGELEEQILLALLHLNGESYAVPIVAKLRELTGRDVSATGAYVVLRRLEARSLLESRMMAGPEARGGRSRRVFAVRDEALPLLRQSQEALTTLWRGLGPVLKKS
ncbi:MAG: PadR family transcriptional regulator [Acidobacteria bacterium]|nr:PadR family transcriptional regulator [Acidobacteriota bacterium]